MALPRHICEILWLALVTCVETNNTVGGSEVPTFSVVILCNSRISACGRYPGLSKPGGLLWRMPNFFAASILSNPPKPWRPVSLRPWSPPRDLCDQDDVTKTRSKNTVDVLGSNMINLLRNKVNINVYGNLYFLSDYFQTIIFPIPCYHGCYLYCVVYNHFARNWPDDIAIFMRTITFVKNRLVKPVI